MIAVVQLTVVDLGLAAALVVALAVLTAVSKLGLARTMLVAAARMVVQLSLVGLVLKWVFDQENLWWVVLISLVMLAVAGHEVWARPKRRLRGWWGFGIGTGAMFVSSFAVSVFGLAAVIQADPWWKPQYAIPVLGMLLGNTDMVHSVSTTPNSGDQQPIGSLEQLRSVPLLLLSWLGMNSTFLANAWLASSYTQCAAVRMILRLSSMSWAGLTTVPEHT